MEKCEKIGISLLTLLTFIAIITLLYSITIELFCISVVLDINVCVCVLLYDFFLPSMQSMLYQYYITVNNLHVIV